MVSRYLITGAIVAFALYQLFYAGSGERDNPPPSRSQSDHRSFSPPEEQQHQERAGNPLREQVQREAQTHARSSAEEDRDDRRPPNSPPSHEGFRESHKAYRHSDYLRAETLSAQGRRHKQEMERCPAAASAVVFEDNNRDRDLRGVNLHSLRVQEAIAHPETAIANALARADPGVRVGVDQGNHSEGGISLKPAHAPPREQWRPKPVSYHVEHQPHQDQNQINQYDEHYAALRAKANEQGNLMAQCFQQSHEAYTAGDGARTKELSERVKQHERKMETLNTSFSPPRCPPEKQQHRECVGYPRREQVQREAQTRARRSVEEDRDDRRPPSSPPSPETPQTPVSPDDEQELWQSIEDGGVCGIHFRASANREGELMKKYFRESQEAYQCGDHLRAKMLSAEGRRRKQEMERFHAEASAVIFENNNRDRDPWDVDLHGLRVEEAIARSETAIANARARAYAKVRLIVGQGNHSEGGISRLKPAIQKAVQSDGNQVYVDPRNAGALIVELPGLT